MNNIKVHITTTRYLTVIMRDPFLKLHKNTELYNQIQCTCYVIIIYTNCFDTLHHKFTNYMYSEELHHKFTNYSQRTKCIPVP